MPKYQITQPGALPERVPQGRAQQVRTAEVRQESMRRLAYHDRVLTKYLSIVGGLSKIAANMANPVRKQLDYKGIARKFAVVEQMEAGVPLIYDEDIQPVPAVRVGALGTQNMIDLVAKRQELEPFEIVAKPQIPYRELYTRRFRVLDRAKDRLIEGMELREDLIFFSALETAANVATGNTPVNNGTQGFDKNGLANAFYQVERNRLMVGSVLMSATGTNGIRRWQYMSIDQMAMQEVRETGYLGNIWGADFYVSDQVPSNWAYPLAQDKFLAWWPVRKDVDVIPADDPGNVRLGFVGYEFIGMIVHNALGVGKLIYSPTGPVSDSAPV